MKTRFVSLCLSCIMLLSCSGCSSDGTKDLPGEAEETSAPVIETVTETEKPSSPASTEAPASMDTKAPQPTPIPTPTPTPTPAASIPEDSYFEVHYIDVGQADSALVICDGEAMLIDGGNSADSSLIYSYLRDHDVSHLDYIVCTHAQEDHAGGLAGALNYATVDVAFSPVKSADNEAFNDFLKYLDRQGVSITEPVAGEDFPLGTATVQILGPLVIDESDPNNTSIVLRVEYGKTSFLFTGDAEREEELDILDAGYSLQSTVLKVGHHGSRSSTIYPFLREVMPIYAVISVGADNSYGHPAEEVLSRLHDANVELYRTDMQGTIIASSDGQDVMFTVERNADANTFAAPTPAPTPTPTVVAPVVPVPEDDENDSTPAGTEYVLNTNTHKFHYPSCANVKKMKDKNKQFYTGTREEVIAMGYDPCGNCHP